MVSVGETRVRGLHATGALMLVTEPPPYFNDMRYASTTVDRFTDNRSLRCAVICAETSRLSFVYCARNSTTSP